MERKVSVYPFPFGTRVFMHRNGVIREAEYRGMRIKDTGICGNNVDTEHIFYGTPCSQKSKIEKSAGR